jgi:ABC-2 type transport system permease protein
MINFNRVFAMFIRYFINLRHNFDRLTDTLYWPALDLFIWGLTGLYVATLSGNNKDYIFIILTGLVFWITIWRMQYEINVNILSEIWDRNIVNIFCSPLTLSEWILSLMTVGFIKMIISFSFSAILAYVIYQYNVFAFGSMLLPIMISLSLTGWAAGFFVGAFIIRYGQKIQTIAWTGVSLIVPFSVIYYPLSILPQWAQKIALLIPSSYVFEAIREVHFTGNFPYIKIVISFALNIIYLIFSLWFFAKMFNKSKKLGLGRLI